MTSPLRGLRRGYRPVAAETRMEFLRLLRQPAYVVPTLLFPLFFYLVFGILFGRGQPGTGAYMLATYGTFGTISPALYGFGVGFALERGAGWLELKRTTPMPALAPFAAKLAASVAFALLVFAELGALAVAAGGVHLPLQQWLLLGCVFMAGSIPFGAFGLALGTLVRPRAAVAVVNLVYMPMALLSGLWVPLYLFPPGLREAAVVFPTYHMAELALTAIGRAKSGGPVPHVAMLGAFSILCLLFAARRLRRSETLLVL